MSDPVLHVDAVAKTYHDGERELSVLRDVSLSVGSGEVVAILGRSGTGKSTLLHILGLLDRPTAGEVRLDGQPAGTLSESARTRLRSRYLGFVFQHYHLLAEMNALENVMLAGAVGGGGFGLVTRTRARELIEAVGLADRARHRPGKLSGGEQQRVAIARSLVNRPALLLCDEPTGNLDPETGAAVLDVFWDVVRRQKTAMVMVTHDTQVARRADRVLRLEDGRLATA